MSQVQSNIMNKDLIQETIKTYLEMIPKPNKSKPKLLEFQLKKFYPSLIESSRNNINNPMVKKIDKIIQSFSDKKKNFQELLKQKDHLNKNFFDTRSSSEKKSKILDKKRSLVCIVNEKFHKIKEKKKSLKNENFSQKMINELHDLHKKFDKKGKIEGFRNKSSLDLMNITLSAWE